MFQTIVQNFRDINDGIEKRRSGILPRESLGKCQFDSCRCTSPCCIHLFLLICLLPPSPSSLSLFFFSRLSRHPFHVPFYLDIVSRIYRRATGIPPQTRNATRMKGRRDGESIERKGRSLNEERNNREHVKRVRQIRSLINYRKCKNTRSIPVATSKVKIVRM